MGAISKAWVVIADAAVDPASPLDTVLMTGLRDDLVHLREWLGFSYTGGAVQDHNHDGVNSSPVAGNVAKVQWWPGLSLPGANFDWCDGGTLLRAAYPALKALLMVESNVTISIANPAVVNWPNHGLRSNMPVKFFTTGALPTGITAGTHGYNVGTWYYVKVVDANNFQIAATPGGASIVTSGVQNGVHTATVAPFGDGDGATTFHKPDLRGSVPFGRDDMGGTSANRLTVGGSGIEARASGQRGGAETVTQTGGTLVSHGHSGSVTGWEQTKGATSGVVWGLAGNTAHSQGVSIGNTGSSSPAQNTPPALVGDWIIQIA